MLTTDYGVIMNRSLIAILSCILLLPVSVLAGQADIAIESHDDPQLRMLYADAQSGSLDAQYALGQVYEYGRGITQDDTAAVCWYRKAADQGLADAQYRLGVLYDNGWGLSVDKAEAVRLYRLAAEQQHDFAQHDLAFMHFKGVGTDKDLVQAYRWLRIADVSGNELMNKHLALVAAQMNLVEIDEAERLARLWLESRR